MKLIALADIHQSGEKWEQLVDTVRQQQPDIVAIAGDLMLKSNGTLAQLDYLPHVRNCAWKIRDAGAELVLILGNDDNQLLVSEFKQGEREGLWHYVADRVSEIKSFEFCGCPWIRDYPFAYKYWVAPDCKNELYINDWQLGPPLLINNKNELEAIPDLKKYLRAKMSISESLEKMAAKVKDMKRSIWLIHEPPAYLGFDHCASGDKVGSPIVFDFISEKQPLLTIHGHIHEAPKYNGGIWADRIGFTTAVQAGQLDKQLYYVTIEIDDDQITGLNHSLYGRSRL